MKPGLIAVVGSAESTELGVLPNTSQIQIHVSAGVQNELAFPFSRTYIKATHATEHDIGNEAFWRAARHAKGSAAWRYHEIATNHMVASNKPEELAQILADIA